MSLEMESRGGGRGGKKETLEVTGEGGEVDTEQGGQMAGRE